MKERLAGFALMTVVVPMALLGYLIILLVGFVGPADRGRAGVRALDHFVNASVASYGLRSLPKMWLLLLTLMMSTMTAPSSALATEPRPPPRLLPPSTAAVSAVTSRPTPVLAPAEARREA